MSEPFQYDLFRQNAVTTWYYSSTLHGLYKDIVTRRVYQQEGQAGEWKVIEETVTEIPTYYCSYNPWPW